MKSSGELPSALIRLYRGQIRLEETRETQDVQDVRWPFSVDYHTICGESHIDAIGTPVEGDVLTFSHAGGEENQARLLSQLVQAGFQVVEFSSKTKSLEDLFLHVTEGRVQ